MKQHKSALVLGCGAVAGAAWQIPYLAEIKKQTGWDPASADTFVGTSVGAVLVSLLAGGVSVETLLAAQQDMESVRKANPSCNWDHDVSTGPWYPPLPKFRFSGKQLFKLRKKLGLKAITANCGLLPTGTFDMTPFRHLIGSIENQAGWLNHDDCRIMVADNQTGERVALKSAQQANIKDAVCASYAVPGWCPPVEINGRTYLDGGIASPISADILADSDIEVVYVLAPMASWQPDASINPATRIERRIRRGMTHTVNKEIEILKGAGKKVVALAPNAAELKAIGFNMMDPRRRQRVFETSQQQAATQVKQALANA